MPNQVEPATNGNSGSIAIDVSGGIPPYTYSWAGPEEFASTSQDISGLTIPGDYCVTVWDACGQRAKLCREIVDDCGYFDRLDISTLNNCLDGHRSLFRVHGAFINPSYSSNYLYLEWTSDASAFTEQSGLGGLQHDGTGIWYHQLISGPTEIEVPESGRYYCRATDERGCSLTAWADFGIETRFFDIDQHVLSEELIVIDGGFIVSSCGSIFNGKNILSGDLSGGSWSDFYSFCFQSDNPDSPPCQGPGAIIIGNTTYHFLVPPNNQAYQINGFNNECGCIFPLEIFNELPYVRHGPYFGPINEVTNYPIYADCECDSWIDLEISVDINNGGPGNPTGLSKCKYKPNEEFSICYLVDYTEFNCSAVATGFWEECSENGGSMEQYQDCPPCLIENIESCWCYDETSTCINVYSSFIDNIRTILHTDACSYEDGVDQQCQFECPNGLVSQDAALNVETPEIPQLNGAVGKPSFQVSVSPNPFWQETRLEVETRAAGLFEVTVSDIYGKRFKNKTWNSRGAKTR
ncbi:MAG: SprB repeat-containing protein [Lewinellaceae bacterium]|nr:SprB repeat-containing protein [Lewinellaceae bacterium]